MLTSQPTTKVLDTHDEQKIESLAQALQLIKTGRISYGPNKDYCFLLDEDGYLILLKRDDEIRDVNFSDDEIKESGAIWPINVYDGRQVLRIHTGENRGLAVTSLFLKAYGIEYQG